MRRLLGLIVVASVAVTGLSACARDKDEKILLNRIIDRTERLARAFVVQDRAETRVEVAGLIEDDFRYKARLKVNGVSIADEVAKDDALAARFLEPEAVPRFLNPDAAVAAATSATPGQVPVLVALRTRRWVLDPVGAPQPERVAADRRVQGDDPVYDALTVLQFARDAVNRARYVQKYSEDRIDPVYKQDEDEFFQPGNDSPITRYDLSPPPFPNASRGSGARQDLPETAHFRKMVIYVQDERVTRIEEVIDVESKHDDMIEAFRLDKDTTARQAIFAINAVRKGSGSEPIRVRRLTVEFSKFGEPLTVDMPTEAVEGSLTVLRYRGRAGAPKPASA
jgi:hypothetical protein